MDLLELYKSEKSSSDSERDTKGDIIDKERYMDLNEVAKVLNRSIFRVRQMYWEGKLGIAVKGVKKIYVEREVVSNVKKNMGSRKEASNGLLYRRYGKRVVVSCEVVIKLIKGDKGITEVEKNRIVGLLIEYMKKGEELVEKYNKKESR